MANFTTSNLVTAQAVFNDIMQSAEMRLPDIAAFQVANTGVLANPSLKVLRSREDRAVTAYFPIRQTAIGGTARAHNHTGARGDSASKSITWSTFSEPFSISIKQADNNMFNWAEQYAYTRRNALLNLMSRIDAWFVAQLVAAKSQVNAGGGNGAFDGTADDYQVPLAEDDYFFQNAKATVEYNQYKGLVAGVIDDKAKMLMQKLSAQGSANNTNFGFQFAGMNLFPTTREILGTTTYKGSGLFFENGLVGVVPWIPVQNRKAIDPKAAMSNLGDYGSIPLPELGLDIAVHTYAERADTSSGGTATNGSTQDVVIQEELSIDIGFVAAPVSVATESPIFSVGQLKA